MSLLRYWCALCALCLFVSSAYGQSNQEQVDELRALMKMLERKLTDLEGGGDAPYNKHVTQIGGSRINRTTEQPEEEVLTVRMYDLSDLFAVAPAYAALHRSDLSAVQQPLFPVVQAQPVGAGGGFGGMGGFGGGGFGGGFMTVRDKPRRLPDESKVTLNQIGMDSNLGHAPNSNLSAAQTSVEELIDAITTTISPEDWDDVGGPQSIATLGNALLISATADTHQQVDALLSLFRKKWGSLRTVSTRAYWIWLNDTQLGELVRDGEAKDAKADEKVEADEESLSREAFGAVDPAAWQAILKQLADAKDKPGGYRATVTCYNGQTVHTVAGGQSLYVTGLTPVLGGVEDSVGYTPGVSVVQEGAALQVTPMTTSSGKYVVLDVHSRVNKLRPAQHAAEKPAIDPKDAVGRVVSAIDRPVLMTHRLSTTLRVPVGPPVLIGGMTFENDPKPGDANLYLFVRLSVQELRDDSDESEEVKEAPEEPKPDGDKPPEVE